MKYQAENLGEIATQFRRNAQVEFTAAERAASQREKAIAEARGATWEAAALILVQTTLNT